MQICVLMPSENGKYYPNYDEMIRNARDEDERKYLTEVRDRHKDWKTKGYDDGFAFGVIFTKRMACGHYEIFQNPIYHPYGQEPTEDDVLHSIEECTRTIRSMRNRKCTRCICGWDVSVKEEK